MARPTFLKDFKGFLQADAYGGYDGIYTGSNGTIVEVGCMAHARNKFSEADSTDPERVLAAKAWVRKLYDVEDEAKAIIVAKADRRRGRCVRLRLRQEKVGTAAGHRCVSGCWSRKSRCCPRARSPPPSTTCSTSGRRSTATRPTATCTSTTTSASER